MAQQNGAENSLALSPLETQVMGQNHWLRGGPAALRVIVLDHETGKPVRAEVRLSLERQENGKPSGLSAALFSGHTNALGTLDAQFTAPAAPPGAYDLKVAVDSPLGKDTVTQPIQIRQSVQVMLTADKPLYQPGQTMHLRALALDMATRRAVSDSPAVFEVEDARGNKVFKQRTTLSRFGVASADFVLADEVNMGTFTLRAVLPQGQAEKKVRVERYVLPKFKVSLTTDRPYYLPGDRVSGTVKADYFFGKPVAGAQVTIAVNTLDIGVSHLGEQQGVTDATGTYHFEYTLPSSFVGQPLEQGKAVVEFHATIKDTADHMQDTHTTVPVVREPISLVLVPESAALVPHVPNRIYISAATPDGAPLKQAAMEVHTDLNPAVTHLVTDDLGLATFTFTPGSQPINVTVRAVDAAGHVCIAGRTLQSGAQQEGTLLRTDKTLARVGDRLNLTVLCSAPGGTVYLDVLRDRQTILTRAEPLHNGEARLSLPVTDDMTGTLEMHAYKILPSEDIIRDTRLVIVSPAGDLNIKVNADQAQYRPGGDAVLHFLVQNNGRHPVAAALGLAMVDESVFALSELQPGLEKVVFTLEKDLMEPKYEIHGLEPAGLLLKEMQPAPPEEQAGRQRAAAMLFAIVPASGDFDFRVNTFTTRWEKVKELAIQKMAEAHKKILNAIARYHQNTGDWLRADDSLTLLVEKGYLRDADLRDPWGHYYRSNMFGHTTYEGYFTLSSAGPDGRWGTSDDLPDISYYTRWRRLGGGFGGGGFGGRGDLMKEREMPAMALMDRAAAPEGLPGAAGPPGQVFNLAATKSAAAGQTGGGEEPVRVRSYFPETMYWNPSLITGDDGRAEVRISMADSITTWRLSMMANSVRGQLGSATAPIKVFQDFFVDIDLPIALTQDDRVDIPVAVYNYLPAAQDVTLTLQEQPWFALNGPSTQVIHIEANSVTAVTYSITVKEIGHYSLTVTARGSRLSDAVRRSIDVLPDGKEVRTAINDRLEGTVDKILTVPAEAIPGASTIWVKLYPGAFSQVVEGLDGLLRMPFGCFEQTSSITYPNVLVLDYLKQTKHINPELQMKAEGYINIGYQRLVTFECKSGGFSWFGDEPAHQILTAYGLLEFSDMAKVHDVDPALIQRTQRWLAGRQKPDGTWEETNHGIAEGIINRQTGALRTTAYVAWALAESGYQGPEIARGVEYVRAHLNEAKDPYTLAVILNLFTVVERDGDTAARVANNLIDMAKQTDKSAFWESGDTPTFTGAVEKGADLETTGLAAYGLVKWGRNAGFINKVLTHLIQSKDGFGTWGSTQGTVWSMKALLYASRNGVGGGTRGKVTVLANGQPVTTFTITPEDSDVMRQVDIGDKIRPGDNAIHLQYEGEGSLLYQIAGRYYVPWSVVEPQVALEPLSLKVAYDKTTLAQDDTATVTVTIHNNTDRIADMPLIDLGVPPGFTVLPDRLDAAVQQKTISKYTLAARQVIVYLTKLDPQQTVTLTYQIKARFPIKARTPLSKAYPYYNPEKVAISAPQDILVRK